MKDPEFPIYLLVSQKHTYFGGGICSHSALVLKIELVKIYVYVKFAKCSVHGVYQCFRRFF